MDINLGTSDGVRHPSSLATSCPLLILQEAMGPWRSPLTSAAIFSLLLVFKGLGILGLRHEPQGWRQKVPPLSSLLSCIIQPSSAYGPFMGSQMSLLSLCGGLALSLHLLALLTGL